MSGHLNRAAHQWRANGSTDVKGATVSIIDGGIAVTRRTGVAHHIADAAEVTFGDETTFVAKWLCGGSSIDAELMQTERVDCLSCRLSAAVPQSPVVYFAWGEGDDDLLYVGSSIKVAQRIRGHISQTAWWPEVRRLTFEEHATELEARRAESAHILKRAGVYNRGGVKPAAAAALGLIVGGESL